MKLETLALALALAGCTPSSSAPGPSTSATPAAGSASAPAAAAPSPMAASAAERPSTGPSAAAPPTSAAPAASALPATAESLVGTSAPDFTATAQNGKSVHLAALKGRPVVLYFYPKDETAGCTKEACSFRDAWQPLVKTGAVLVGISADTLDSHRAFTEHWKLPFLLVSDPDGAIAQLYGVPFHGVHKRQTIVIGPDGKIAKVYRSVDVSVHAQEVLGDLDHLS
jgi:peroxiredoxin Q/BCP